MFDKVVGDPLERRRESGSERFVAGPGTDYFRDPTSEGVIENAPFVYEELLDDFTLTVRVSPRFQGTYDAGALLLIAGEGEWLKLAYENTDLGYPAIVSVVTRGRSDDCNGEGWPSGSVILRLSRSGDAVGCYYGDSREGLKMHRLLRIPGPGGSAPVRVGLSVQSPKGAGTEASFSEIDLQRVAVADMRKGLL